MLWVLVLFCFAFPSPVFADTASGDVRVFLNDVPLSFAVQPVIEKGTTLVPMRTIFGALGADVRWVPSTREVIAEKDGVRIYLQIGRPSMRKDGYEILLPVAPVLRNGTTLVPLRAVSEVFQVDIRWDGVARHVHLSTDDPDVAAVPPADPASLRANAETSAARAALGNDEDHPGVIGFIDSKRIVTSLDTNNYVDLKIVGGKLKLAGTFAYDDYDVVRVTLRTGSDFEHLTDVTDQPDFLLNPALIDESSPESYQETWELAQGVISLKDDDSHFTYEFDLRDVPVQQVLIYGLKYENRYADDGFDDMDWVMLYDYYFYIEKRNGEWVFLKPDWKIYQNNLNAVKRLGDPKAHLDTSYMSAEERKKLTELANAVTKGAKSDREKLLRIHDYITETFFYNWDHVYDEDVPNYDATLDILKYLTTQCYGFSVMFVDLARLQGIPVTKPIGYVSYDPYQPRGRYDDGDIFNLHSWVAAYVDGRWIYIDPTWNNNNEQEDGKHKRFKPEHTYFDLDLYLMSFTHDFDYFREEHDWEE